MQDLFCICKQKTFSLVSSIKYVFFFRYFIYLPHDYNNYKKMLKKNVGRWRGGLNETIELMLIRPPRLQFFQDGIKITATDTI